MTIHLAFLRFITYRVFVRSRMDVKLVFQNLQCTILADDKLLKQIFVDTIMKFPFIRDAGLSTLN